jgi:hypothetical protein
MAFTCYKGGVPITRWEGETDLQSLQIRVAKRIYIWTIGLLRVSDMLCMIRLLDLQLNSASPYPLQTPLAIAPFAERHNHRAA